MPNTSAFLKRTNDFTFIVVILALIALQALLKKTLLSEVDLLSPVSLGIEVLFNFLLSTCLFGFYIKKYNPDRIRRIFMAIFFIELIVGVFLKKLHIPYSNEIVFVAFIGILLTWLNTHLRRKKFIPEEN